MRVFVDTSALYAYYDADDSHHPEAVRLLQGLLGSDVPLVTTNYVLVETAALLQRRLGLAWAERLQAEAKPLLQVVWVDEALHDAAAAAGVAANQRDLSLVDCVSFQVMAALGIRHAVAFDQHFPERGFALPEV
jgi:predicted nucleic acid-binding protein